MFGNMFPNSSSYYCKITSPQTRLYNCIAWSVGDERFYIWPEMGYYWPKQLERVLSVDVFIEFYKLFGFRISSNFELESGKEKVALYVVGDEPQHAARQLDNGLWASKIGDLADIEHELPGLAGPTYGKPAVALERSRVGPHPPFPPLDPAPGLVDQDGNPIGGSIVR